MRKMHILLADDHKMMREGLRILVNAQEDMEVVGEASDGREAITLARKLHPDVVIMDISMPELNGQKATEKLKDSCPDVKILILTRHTEDGYLQQLLKVGVNGYVLKQSASVELVRAIRAVVAGQSYVDPAVTSKLVGSVVGSRVPHGSPADKNLSKREEEVLRLVAWGYLSKEIAGKLEISIKTVETHKANAMKKMGMKSRIAIVRYALLKGWLQDT